MKDDNKTKVKQIFCDVLGVSESEITDDTAYNSCESWDSLKHLQIISELEDEFHIDLEMDDVIGMDNFKKAIDTIDKYIEN